jgi:hypothetical protein
MAGIEALTPSLSSEPQARVWAQIKALQQRVATLESRRNLIVRFCETGAFSDSTGAIPGTGGFSYIERTFTTSGRTLLVLYGTNRVFIPSGLPFANTALRISDGSVFNLSALAALYNNSTAPGQYANTTQDSALGTLDPGTYTMQIKVPDTSIAGEQFRWSVQVFELPA